jgi:hypothetical protein
MLALGHEQRGVEFNLKGPVMELSSVPCEGDPSGSRETNRRDRGYIVLGIDDAAPHSGGPGLTPAGR